MSRVALAALVAVALGAGTTALAVGAGDAPAGNGVTVDLADSTLEPSADRISPGRVDLAVRNTGRTEHDLLIVRTNLAAGDLPVGLEGVRPSLAGRVVLGREHSAHEHAAQTGRAHHLASGETRVRTVRLARGSYVLLCPLPGHYEAGQRASLTVR